MPVMTLAGLLAHEIDLLARGFTIEFGETGKHKRDEGKYYCRAIKTRFQATVKYGDCLHVTKRNAIIAAYDNMNKKKVKGKRKGKKNGLHD